MTQVGQDKSGLVDLLKRVQAATGADRELDLWIWFRVVNPPETGMLGLTLEEAIAAYPDTLEQVAKWWRDPLPHVTASLDAALALLERALPEWGATITLALGGGSTASVFNRAGRTYDCNGDTNICLSDWLAQGNVHRPSPALAIIAATLQALIANPISQHGKAR